MGSGIWRGADIAVLGACAKEMGGRFSWTSVSSVWRLQALLRSGAVDGWGGVGGNVAACRIACRRKTACLRAGRVRNRKKKRNKLHHAAAPPHLRGARRGRKNFVHIRNVREGRRTAARWQRWRAAIAPERGYLAVPLEINSTHPAPGGPPSAQASGVQAPNFTPPRPPAPPGCARRPRRPMPRGTSYSRPRPIPCLTLTRPPGRKAPGPVRFLQRGAA